MTDRRAEALRGFVEEFTDGKTTEVRVIGPPDGASYRVVLVRGSRERELLKRFPWEYVDDYPAMKEYKAELRHLVATALEQLLLLPDERRAALLAALEQHHERQPGTLMPGDMLAAAYSHLTGGDVLHEADLQYLCEKQLVEFYRRPEASMTLSELASGGGWIDARTGQRAARDDPRFRLMPVDEEDEAALVEAMAVRILAAGQDWLESWRQTRAQRAQGLYEVFISGCQDELEDERLAAREAIEEQEELRSRFKVVAFEQDLSPSSRSPQEETEEAARRCDVYLGLFGARYGTPGSDGLSPTEREYRVAVADMKERPSRRKDFWIFRSDRKKGQEEPLLKKLMDELADPQRGRIYYEFRNYKDLKLAIQRACRRYLAERGRDA